MLMQCKCKWTIIGDPLKMLTQWWFLLPAALSKLLLQPSPWQKHWWITWRETKDQMKYLVSYIALKCLLCACEQARISQLCAITSISQLLATGWGGGFREDEDLILKTRITILHIFSIIINFVISFTSLHTIIFWFNLATRKAFIALNQGAGVCVVATLLFRILRVDVASVALTILSVFDQK